MNQPCFKLHLFSLVLLHHLQLWVSLGVTMADSSHCFYCREDLGGKRFVRNEGKPVCVRCHTKFCANTCAECHRPIPVESKVRLSCMYLFSGPCFLHVPVISLSPPSSIRSSAIKAGSGTRSASVVRSVTSLWPKSPSAPRMIASCVGSAAPRRTLHAATAAINPSWLVRQQL